MHPNNPIYFRASTLCVAVLRNADDKQIPNTLAVNVSYTLCYSYHSFVSSERFPAVTITCNFSDL